MSFALVAETGAGLANANSYTTVEEADDYISVNIHAAPKWAALTVEVKEKLLVWASRYLDSHAVWYGEKKTGLSALRWPRTNTKDVDGIDIKDNVVPQAVKNATASLAVYLLDTDRNLERPQDGLESIKVDVIELVFREGYTLPKFPKNINWMLRGLGGVESGQIRFKRIRR